MKRQEIKNTEASGYYDLVTLNTHMVAVMNRTKPKWNKNYRREGYGPAMSQLSRLQQKFVEELYKTPGTPWIQALFGAGYKSRGSQEPKKVYEAAHQLCVNLKKNPLVLDAIKEMGIKEYQAKLPAAIGALDRVIMDPKHRHHVQVLHGLLDRVGMPAVTETKTVVTHDLSAWEVVAKLKALAQKLDLADDHGAINDSRLTLLGKQVVNAETVDAEVVVEGEASD